MGQGLHTKMAQIAASAFNIPLSSVFISETSTDKVFVSILVCTLRMYRANYSPYCWKSQTEIINLMRITCFRNAYNEINMLPEIVVAN